MKLDKKGVVLVIALMIMVVLLVLTAVYFSGLLTEKKSADTEEFVMQALGLAEAGANHALAELRERIRVDLQQKVSAPGVTAAQVLACPTGNCPLDFLYNFAYVDENDKFSVPADGKTNIEITPLNLNTGVQGSYNDATITVTAVEPSSCPCNENPSSKNPKRACVSETDVYRFYYNYSIDATGTVTATSPNIIRRVSLLGGSFAITVQRGNFSRFALFTNHHRMPSNTTVWFTANTNFTGPVHTNERFSFANNPSAHFTDEAAQHLTTARFYNNGGTALLNADRNPAGCCPDCILCTASPGCCEGGDCTTCCVEDGACSSKPSCVICKDYPVFDADITRGADLINLPSSVTQQDLKKQATGDQNDGPWANGVYLPNQDGSLVGGVYIKGNASNLTMSVESGKPVYTITQGSNIKKITLDYTNNQTIVANVSGTGGTAAGTYTGIPNGIGDEGVLVYANGSISNFSGTVQTDTEVTVSSDSDISINNHIMYQDYNAGPPPDATGYTNLLGILSWNGDVRISTSAPNNLNIHGVVMAAGRDQVFSVDNYQFGSPRGVVTLLGGAITDFYGPFGTFSGSLPISGYGRNFVYDARMLQGRSPPYFPTVDQFDTSISDSDDDGVDDLGNKLIWQDKGA